MTTKILKSLPKIGGVKVKVKREFWRLLGLRPVNMLEPSHPSGGVVSTQPIYTILCFCFTPLNLFLSCSHPRVLV